MCEEVTVRVPGSTSNLGPGLDALGLALQIYNTFTFSMREDQSGPLVTVEGQGCETLDTGVDNLTYKAYAQVFLSHDLRVPDVAIHQKNEIPISRGLGGSATAVLAGILAGYRHLERCARPNEILNQGARIEGFADNLTASLLGGLITYTYEDGVVTFVRVPMPVELSLVVYFPTVPIATKESRKVLPKCVSLDDAVFNVRCSSLLVAALATGSLEIVRVAMRDRLHQQYRATLLPGLSEVFDAAIDAGGLGAALSGAGSAICAIAVENEVEIGEAMVEVGSACGLSGYYRQLAIDDDGARLMVN